MRMSQRRSKIVNGRSDKRIKRNIYQKRGFPRLHEGSFSGSRGDVEILYCRLFVDPGSETIMLETDRISVPYQ
jgi:hypothetical protein